MACAIMLVVRSHNWCPIRISVSLSGPRLLPEYTASANVSPIVFLAVILSQL